MDYSMQAQATKGSLLAGHNGSLPPWMFWAFIALAVLLVFFFIVLPLYRKIKRKRLKVKETSEIKKDLMIWHHLAQLVRGGNAHQKAKQALSEQIVKINGLFNQGLQILAMHSRKIYEQPWVVIVGEPLSGKSTLLRNSEQEMVVSVEEENGGDEKKSSPLRLWLGAKSVVCDVSGHVFFDRWLNGSSAEWNYIARLLRRKRYRKPLDGVVITIPADALLADDEALTQQKAILMTTEISQLLHTIGMNLPCTIVVTKTDMVNGFSEYVMGINDDLRSQIFGWLNDDAGLDYNASKFKDFWDGLIARLRAGCEKSMLSKNVATKLSALSNRMEITGKIYLFAENFDKLYANLSIYLRTLFGDGNFHGTDNAVLKGVFFTSAKEGEVSLSPSFAQLCGRSVEEAPVPNAHRNNSRPYFIRDLLQKVIFHSSSDAVFIKAERIKRNIPKYFLCLAMLGVSAFWLFTAYFKTAEFEDYLEPTTEYYASLAPLLRSGVAFNYPILKKNQDGRYVLNNEQIPGYPVPLLHFFYEVFSERETEVVAPWGFKTAGVAVFGYDKYLGYAEKAFIYNQLYGILVRMPVIKNTSEKLTEQGTEAELNANKRSVINSLLLLDVVENEDYMGVVPKLAVKDMLRFLMPELPAETMGLLDSYLVKYDRKYTMTMDLPYLRSKGFFAAQKTALSSMLYSWQNLNAYPDALYSQVRSAVRLSQNLNATFDDLNGLLSRLDSTATVRQLRDTVTEWNETLKKQKRQALQLKMLIQGIQAASSYKKTPDKKTTEKAELVIWKNDLAVEVLLHRATQEYEGLLKKDFALLSENAVLFPTREGETTAVQKIIDDQENKIFALLDQEKDKLHSEIGRLKENQLYHWQYMEQPNASGYTYQILEQLYAAATLFDEDVETEGSFTSKWAKVQQKIKKAIERYDALAKQYAENEEISKAAAEIRKMLLAQADLSRFVVLNSELEKVPSTEAEFYNIIESKAQDENVFDFSPQLAKEALGDLRYSKGYDPKTGHSLFEDLFRVVRSFMKNVKVGQNDDVSAPFPDEYDRYSEAKSVFEEYLTDYMRYWGSYPDNVYVPAASWAEFKERLTTLKAFKINSLLQTVYMRCLDILRRIDDVLLSEQMKREKDEYIALISDELKMLTPLFTDAGEKTLNAWASLSVEVDKAWNELLSVTEQELKSMFFNVYTTTWRSKISWWNDFVDNGVALLRQENEKMLEDSLQSINDSPDKNEGVSENGVQSANSSSDGNKNGLRKTFQSMNAFPLCKDCNGKKVVSPEEMPKLVRLLQGVTNSEKDEGDTLLKRNLDLFKDKESLAWASDVLKVAEWLTNKKKPLIWTLYQAPVDLQNSLVSGKEVAAVNRFRTVEVALPDVKTNKRFSTSMGAQTAIGQGSVASALTLNFYKLSGDGKPEAQIRLNDPWAILRIYLKNGGRYDSNSGLTYVPLTIKDHTGAKFVYFVTVKFNQDIFSPEEWPVKRPIKKAVSP